METEPRLDASRPSRLRLIAFGLTAAGALLMGIGSLLTWVTVGLSDLVGLQTRSPGTDIGGGLIVLVAAVIILVLIIMSRVVAGPTRRVMAIVIVAAAAIAAGFAAWFVASAADHYSPVEDDTLVNAIAQQTGKSADEVRTALTTVVDKLGGYTHIGPGPWVAIAGGLLAIVGGILTYRWASRVGPTAELPPH